MCNKHAILFIVFLTFISVQFLMIVEILAVGREVEKCFNFCFFVVVTFLRPNEIFYLQQNTGLNVSFTLNWNIFFSGIGTKISGSEVGYFCQIFPHFLFIWLSLSLPCRFAQSSLQNIGCVEAEENCDCKSIMFYYQEITSGYYEHPTTHTQNNITHVPWISLLRVLDHQDNSQVFSSTKQTQSH